MPQDSLLAERDEDYGDAWIVTGKVMGFLSEHVGALLVKAPELSLAWVQILNKLIRVAFSPHKIDHWRDIQGYARLAELEIEKAWKEPVEVTSK